MVLMSPLERPLHDTNNVSQGLTARSSCRFVALNYASEVCAETISEFAQIASDKYDRSLEKIRIDHGGLCGGAIDVADSAGRVAAGEAMKSRVKVTNETTDASQISAACAALVPAEVEDYRKGGACDSNK
jgi:hypothetical protein